jgi:hypothetical protein
MKVLLAAMLVDALHAALEYREIALDGVRRDDASDIFFEAVIDRFVAPKLFVQAAIRTRLVGHDGGLSLDVRANDGEHRARYGAVNVERANGTTTLH